jgi:SAM-dependent methyltransferase
MSSGEATRSHPDESLWMRLQYRILKRIAPTDRSRMTGSAYAGTSKLRVLLGDDLLTRIKDKDVLDFGCGLGAEAVEMAGVARSVHGLDILTASLEKARQRAEAAGVSHKCTFGSTPPPHAIDAIISLDSFEHFGDPADILRTMYSLLRPGGQVLVSFGPPWMHPLGGHLFAVFPWAHLLFSEAALIRWRSDFRSDGATRFSEVEGGLNQMTIGRFERLVAESPFRLVYMEAVPIRRLEPIANRVTREFTTAIVRCVLERPVGGGASGNASDHLAGTP